MQQKEDNIKRVLCRLVSPTYACVKILFILWREEKNKDFMNETHSLQLMLCISCGYDAIHIVFERDTRRGVEVKEKEKVDNICLGLLSLSTVALLCFELEFGYKSENVIIVTDPTAFERMQQRERETLGSRAVNQNCTIF